MNEYAGVMKLYTRGTGGGDGDPASYVCWEEREDTNILRYHNNTSSQYLTWVFMSNKQYSFVLAKKKVRYLQELQLMIQR